MKISDYQHARLAELTCLRLSADENHQLLIKEVENSRNPGLVTYLNESGWDEDIDGSTAFYLIKDAEGEIVFFFSLKCGALFQHLNETQIQQQKKFFELAKRVISAPENDEDRQIAALILDKFRLSGYINDDDIKLLAKVKSTRKQLKEVLQDLSDDKVRDPNEHIVRVASTHSGVELVHFCTNDKTRKKWAGYGCPHHSIGKVMFWKFIIPIVEEVRRLVGCKYLFLFAADNTEDMTLVNYYETDLHFERPSHLGTSKPRYDFNCVFMCQEIDSMIEHRKRFFENFNPDLDDERI